MKKEQQLYLAGAIGETLICIPLIGLIIKYSLLYVPLFLLLCVHITALNSSLRSSKKSVHPSILGIIACSIDIAFGWFPIIGWITAWLLHIISAIFNYIAAFKKEKINL